MHQKPIESELSTRLSTRLSTSCRLDCRLVVYCRSYGTWTGRRRGVHGTWAARGRDADGTWTGSARDMDGAWAGNGRDVDRTTGELCSFEPAYGSAAKAGIVIGQVGGAKWKLKTTPPRIDSSTFATTNVQSIISAKRSGPVLS